MRINPVLRNESKLTTRTAKFSTMIFIYVAILAIATMIFYKTANDDIFINGLDLQGAMVLYIIMAIGQAILLMFIVPSLTSTAICSEREKQTLDILLSTKLSPIQIITGKVLSSTLKVSMLIICTMPLYAVCGLVGGIKLSNILQLMIFFIINTLFVGALGVFVSTYVKTSKVATALTYALVLFIYVGIIIITWALFMFTMIKLGNSGTITSTPQASIIMYISPIAGFASLLINQIGAGTEFSFMFNEFGISQYAEYISIAIQLVLTCVFIQLAAIKLNPLNKIGRRKNKKIGAK